ncbi:hypothetical protein BDV26DRAFT_290977 [Aspergillus bertholletiae]|uniref:Azaphilone pigments biosynthesis cluster protein L N-terminal domain-containing protein n=1 Tax=Aspergillus bertholletiae TaxID=1226010 RepID=A0A5N7BDP4_9EURO|nr:hypothetical protein BDV26DRAFT_290977 [Aspergillus bertholletiae]
MSGLEAIGVAASILQIAELGSNLSISLWTLYRKFKDADRNLQTLNNELALTCNVLRQLGNNLQQDEQSKLYSTQALITASDVHKECEQVFEKIKDIVGVRTEETSAKSRLRRVAQKFRFVLDESQLEALKNGLEHLKSTILLLLNTIMFAEQIRSRETSSMLEEQYALLQMLVQEKQANERRLSPEDDDMRLDDAPSPQNMLSAELKTYYSLVQKVLSEIDASKFNLERGQHHRVKRGVLKIHEEEIDYAGRMFGSEVSQILSQATFENVASMTKSYAANEDRHSPGLETIQAEDRTDDRIPPHLCTKRKSSSADRPITCKSSLCKPSRTDGDSVPMSQSNPNHPDITRYERMSRVFEGRGYSGHDDSPMKKRRVELKATRSVPDPIKAIEPPNPSYSTPITQPLGNPCTQINEAPISGAYKCLFPGCTSSPFQSQDMLE